MFEFTTKVKVPFDVISDMLSMVDESINYWGSAASLNINDEEGSFSIEVVDHEEEQEYSACEDDVNGALQYLSDNFPWHIQDMLNENWDVETVDVFVQALLFTDIIYG